LILSILACGLNFPIIWGAAFIQKEPEAFECLIDGQWQACDKEYICGAGLTQDQYRAVPGDETFENWVQQMDLLCTDKYLIGLKNSMFFGGVIISCLIVPPLADAYGRKVPFLISIGINVLVYFALLFTTNLWVAYTLFFVLGLSFAGRMVVGVNYVLEFF
jgi:MFS family permease